MTNDELETIDQSRTKVWNNNFDVWTVLLTAAYYDDFRERKRSKHICATTLNTAAWFYRKEAETNFSQLKISEIAGLLSI